MASLFAHVLHLDRLYLELVIVLFAFVSGGAIVACWRADTHPRTWFPPVDEPHDAPVQMDEAKQRQIFEALHRDLHRRTSGRMTHEQES